jgi:hypothetical protein
MELRRRGVGCSGLPEGGEQNTCFVIGLRRDRMIAQLVTTENSPAERESFSSDRTSSLDGNKLMGGDRSSTSSGGRTKLRATAMTGVVHHP